MLIAGLPVFPAVLMAFNTAAPTPSPMVEYPAAPQTAQVSATTVVAVEYRIEQGNEGSDAPIASKGAVDPSPAETERLEDADIQSSSISVFSDSSDDAVVGRVVEYLEGLTTMKGEFVQSAPSGAISTGSFWLRRPGQIRFEYDEPTPLMIVATQGNVYVQDKSIDQTDLYPINKTPLRFLLSQRIDLTDVNIRSVERGIDSVAVTFSAKNEDETDGDLSIVLAAPDLTLKQWVIRDPQNGVTIVTLKNAESGVRLANSLFRAPQAGGAFINN